MSDSREQEGEDRKRGGGEAGAAARGEGRADAEERRAGREHQCRERERLSPAGPCAGGCRGGRGRSPAGPRRSSRRRSRRAGRRRPTGAPRRTPRAGPPRYASASRRAAEAGDGGGALPRPCAPWPGAAPAEPPRVPPPTARSARPAGACRCGTACRWAAGGRLARRRRDRGRTAGRRDGGGSRVGGARRDRREECEAARASSGRLSRRDVTHHEIATDPRPRHPWRGSIAIPQTRYRVRAQALAAPVSR